MPDSANLLRYTELEILVHSHSSYHLCFEQEVLKTLSPAEPQTAHSE